ncbi:MAG: tRNA-binding protein [Bacteroidia bacterium]
MEEIIFEDFLKIELRTGTIIKAQVFEGAKKPAYQIWVNFGSTIGVKKSSAQVTHLYKPEELIGKQIIGVINFKPKQIGSFMSEFLLTGFENDEGKIVLAVPDKPVPNGKKLI